MKLTFEFNNIAKSPLRKDFFEAATKRVFKKLNYDFLKKKNILISAAVVSEAEIKKLNKIYRHKDETTDVLSFAEYKNEKELKYAVDNPATAGLFLGELVLCYDYIKEYAEKRKTKLDQELANAVSHGILHLLGFKHGKKMFLIQSAVVNSERTKK